MASQHVPENLMKDDEGHHHVGEMLDALSEHPETVPVPIADAIDAFVAKVAKFFAWANALLIAAILIQVVLRYAFNNGLVFFEELQWHLYAIGVMFGVSFAQVKDAHIRVDIVHMQMSDRTRRIAEVFGIVVLLLPFCWVVFDHSLDFVYESWRVGETSDASTGLPYRWLIKSVIPASFFLLGLAAISRLIRDVTLLSRGSGQNNEQAKA